MKNALALCIKKVVHPKFPLMFKNMSDILVYTINISQFSSFLFYNYYID